MQEALQPLDNVLERGSIFPWHGWGCHQCIIFAKVLADTVAGSTLTVMKIISGANPLKQVLLEVTNRKSINESLSFELGT